jgi:hypothetical protein
MPPPDWLSDCDARERLEQLYSEGLLNEAYYKSYLLLILLRPHMHKSSKRCVIKKSLFHLLMMNFHPGVVSQKLLNLTKDPTTLRKGR